jgi:hypothetical protein
MILGSEFTSPPAPDSRNPGSPKPGPSVPALVFVFGSSVILSFYAASTRLPDHPLLRSCLNRDDSRPDRAAWQGEEPENPGFWGWSGLSILRRIRDPIRLDLSLFPLRRFGCGQEQKESCHCVFGL